MPHRRKHGSKERKHDHHHKSSSKRGGAVSSSSSSSSRHSKSSSERRSSCKSKSSSDNNNMPNWEGIEDVSLHASRVWLSRACDTVSDSTTADEANKNNKKKKDTSVIATATGWTPLRKCDCRALNETPTKPTHIESGRCTADPMSGKIFYNFLRGPQRELTSAVWFVRVPKSNKSSSAGTTPSKGESTTKSSSSSSKDYALVPIADKEDSNQIETLYKRAIAASSSLGKGVSTMLNNDKEVILLKDESKVQLVQTGDMLAMKRTPQGWFAHPQVLQRGYGEYSVEGEEEEEILGPVKSLVFVVHGIGEAMFARDDVQMASLVEQMHMLRMATEKRQVQLYKMECEAATKQGLPPPAPPNRIEFLPIEWYNRLHDSSTELMKSLKAVSLQTIPALRAIANDIIFDVLLYLTPTFCEAVLECVTEQVNALYKAFSQVHKDFHAHGGTCSFIGHSLGSVIVWDLLSLLKDAEEETRFCGVSTDATVGYQAYLADKTDANQARNGSWGPSLPKKMEQTISFTPVHTILIGSPMGMFLTLRGAHAVFDAMRQAAVEDAKKKAAAAATALTSSGTTSATEANAAASAIVEVPMASPFVLPTGSLYNIFNPSDPVAYRIEPLLLSQGTDYDSIPQPVYLTAPGKDLRLHLKAKQFGEAFSKSLMDQKSTWNALVETAVNFVTPADKKIAADAAAKGETQYKEGPLRFPLGGKTERVDYSFQPGVVENEYISAVLAHSTSTYFCNQDFQDFIIKLLDPPVAPPTPPPSESSEKLEASLANQAKSWKRHEIDRDGKTRR